MNAGDYPRSSAELNRRFPDEQACREYLFALRWPSGFSCPHCRGDKAWPLQSGRFECAVCGHQISVTAGTIFQGTRIPLTVWFRAVWWIIEMEEISAVDLQRELGCASYQTAWTCLHKLRHAMAFPGLKRLEGVVQIGHSFLNAFQKSNSLFNVSSPPLIMIAVETRGQETGQIRLRHIPTVDLFDPVRFIVATVEPGSMVHTDGWKRYLLNNQPAYGQIVTQLPGNPDEASELLPHVQQVLSLLEQWLQQRRYSAVSHVHLQNYLDEYAFNFNCPRVRSILFYRLLQQAVMTEPTTYKEITGSKANRAKSKSK